GGKFETRSVWRNVFRSCSPKIPNRRNLENFPSGRRGCGERWEELPGFTTRLSKGPKNFFRGSAHRPRKRGGSRSSSVETGGVRREGRRRTRAQPRTREGRNGAQGVEAASAARASFRRFIRLRMRSRLRLEIRST